MTRPHKVFGRLLVKADGVEWHVSLQRDGLHLRKKHALKKKEKVVGFGLLVDTHANGQLHFNYERREEKSLGETV